MRQLWTPGWLVRHAIAVCLVAGFLALGWWQVHRAAGGNTLSWAYAVEWPVFAAFVGYVWAKEVRGAVRPDRDRVSAPRGPRRGVDGQPTRPPVVVNRAVGAAAGAPAVPTGPDPEESTLAAYNHYLAWLRANPDAAPSDYPGRS
jgi:hypothetical protein